MPSSSGRLVVEQIYGYMCWNSYAYGLLTTATGFVFLFRDDIENLWISNMFGSNDSLETGGATFCPPPFLSIIGLTFNMSYIGSLI